jgi:hypothetical protein
MTPTVIAIDPGKNAGIAFFKDGFLYSADLHNGLDDYRVAVAPFQFGHVVCEIPQVYRGSRVSTQSLTTLAFRAGYLVGLMRPSKQYLVKPSQWKGQIPKDIHHEQILRQLDVGELLVLDERLQNIPKSKRHNVYDAVGLGLWYLQRRLKCRSIRKGG